MVLPDVYIRHVNHTDSWTVRLSVHSLTFTIRGSVPSFFGRNLDLCQYGGGLAIPMFYPTMWRTINRGMVVTIWYIWSSTILLLQFRGFKFCSIYFCEYFCPWGRIKHWSSQPIYRYSHFTEMNFEASYTQNFRVTEVRIISSVDIFAMMMTLSIFTQHFCCWSSKIIFLILYLDFIGWPAFWTEDNY